MDTNAESKNFYRLLRRLIRWLRRQIGISEAYKPPGTLEGRSDTATLWRITPTDPGICAVWWICNEGATHDLVLSVLSIAQLREDIALKHGYSRSSDPIRVSKSTFTTDLHKHLSEQNLQPKFISHFFIVVWRSRIPYTRGPHDRRAYQIRPLANIPGDFQGASIGWGAGDRYALKIAEVIARRLLSTSGRLNTWEEIIDRIDWVEWLDFYCCRLIGPKHIFQPKKGPQ